MVAIASLRRLLSAIRRKFTRGLKKLFLRVGESQMRKAQLEIDRYYRGRRFFEREDHASSFESVSIAWPIGADREAIAAPILCVPPVEKHDDGGQLLISEKQ